MAGMILRDTPLRGSAARSQQRAGQSARPRVLVAEDHDDTRLMLKILLEHRGFDVLEAADGEEAVRIIEDAHPDLVVLDGSLPRMNGVAVTRRARESARSTPIIFLSGHAEPLARTEAFDAGCDEYLVKPDGLNHLSYVLARHLGRSGQA